ncbi:MAG TPA: FHA domain-containing protein [Bryobacteraceae bacterium]|jgi:pSer/pThr/pTyr-binding forkhead associated (FHA) protein|nr:FHA domain-containing protein [Bryobacteraceae bacterium]
MERILIRHLSGARAGQVDEFPAASTNEILVGRDPDAAVCFDPSREDLVSRQHVKIVRDPESPREFSVVDLQSRNGTFLNRQRIYAPAHLAHDDVIQLGPAGPEFRFELDPPPVNVVTRPLERPANTLMLSPIREEPVATPRPIGRATVERMLGDTFTKVKHESDKAVWVGAAALTAILAVGGISYIYMRQNAVDANQQAQQNAQALQQNAQALQQMGQDVKRTPEVAQAAMREEVERLNAQLKSADERNEQRLSHLSQQISQEEAVTKQAVRDMAERQQAQSIPAVPQADIPASTPTPAPREANPKDYDAGVKTGVGLLQNGDPDGAMKVAQQLMHSQPNRWEAYSIAASVAKVQNKPSQARLMFQKALSLAPDEVKPSLQQALQEISRGGQ